MLCFKKPDCELNVQARTFDTLVIDNNLPMQWSIKIKLAPLGSPLNLHKWFSKSLHLVKGQRSYEAVKITHTFTTGQVILTIAVLTTNLW